MQIVVAPFSKVWNSNKPSDDLVRLKWSIIRMHSTLCMADDL